MRTLRMRRRWSQAQLAAVSGVSRSVIGRIERNQADGVAARTLIRIAAQLDARVDIRLLWHGEGLDRLLDAEHARLVETTIAILTASGWDAAAEVTFNIWGQRGSIDVLGFHAATGSLVIVEVKSVVPDLQAMLAGIDQKGRLGLDVGRQRGWRSTTVSRVLVLPDDRTARRRIQLHSATFGSVLPARTAEVRRWVKRPSGAMNGIIFLPDVRQAGTRHRTSSLVLPL